MNDFFVRYPQLSQCKEDIENSVSCLIDTFNNGGKLLLCGNGGSSSDCDHIVGELLKNFRKSRKPDKKLIKKIENLYPNEKDRLLSSIQGGIPAINLSSQTGFLTAFINDADGDMIFAQLVSVLGNKNDTLLAISTSGNSENIIFALMVAKAVGLKTICLTGDKECKAEQYSDIVIKVPETETYKIQELHLPVYHYICLKIEEQFF